MTDQTEPNSQLDKLLLKYSSLKYNDTRTKVVCAWSGHEMPLKVESVQSYVDGGKYRQLLAKSIDTVTLQRYSEFLVESKHPKRKRSQWFCVLTQRHVNKQPYHIQLHFSGYRFLKAHHHWLECEASGKKFVPFSKQAQSKRTSAAYEREEELNRIEDDGSDIAATDGKLSGDVSDGDESDLDSDADSMSDLFPEMFECVAIDHAEFDKSDAQMQCDTEGDDNESISKTNGKTGKTDFSAEAREGTTKRKLDTKLTKKLKVEPTKKKANSLKNKI